jgi:pyruvate/2-oxoglutarate dehydrogenase complex dihydrolipoamide acyltransferase (E2) component
MSETRKPFLVTLMAVLLVLAPAVTPAAMAQTPVTQAPQHVVSPAELQQAVAASARARQQKEASVEKFLTSPSARQTLKKAGMNYQEVRQAVPFLSSSELANLSARADSAQREFDAGAMTNQQLTYIIIALATAVIVLVLVKA